MQLSLIHSVTKSPNVIYTGKVRDPVVIIDQDDELVHAGRKGMKWGQNIFTKNKTEAQIHTAAAKKLEAHAARSSSAAANSKNPISKKMHSNNAKKAAADATVQRTLAAKKTAKAQKAKEKYEAKAATAKERAEAKKKLSQSPKKMTNKELQDHITRMQLEENFLRLQKNQNARYATRAQKGQALALEIVGGAAKKTAQRSVEKLMMEALTAGVQSEASKKAATSAAASARNLLNKK